MFILGYRHQHGSSGQAASSHDDPAARLDTSQQNLPSDDSQVASALKLTYSFNRLFDKSFRHILTFTTVLQMGLERRSIQTVRF